ncbi:MFS transporter [Phenylobacterium sp.]|uniref:MFS transporter n=1 Tax=Phenylobacterium sp. TaxID=1871053 RepID=UPI002C3F6E91|nr:MFS transporter [Phenylobacterium sp.]HLZ74213.1 MFS transporter [Phenylobacterium sp.]
MVDPALVVAPAAVRAGVNATAGPTRKAILAATIGNALEFYDFITYGFFSIQVGRAFFPAHSEYASLMLSLGLFGAGFVARPIGGIVIGAYADRVGRRPAMMLSFALMGLAIIGLACIPSYAAIGIVAPILAVIARLVQGFSLGGEVGPTTAYLMEAADSRRRGLTVSWQGASQGLAGTVAALVGFTLSSLLPPAALDAYGWRVAFLLGAVTLPYGLWLRRNLPETLHTPEPAGTVAAADSESRGALMAASRRVLLLGLLVISAGSIASSVSSYMTTFAQHALHMRPSLAFAGGVISSLSGVIGYLGGGWLSDRVGRRPVMIAPALAHLLVMIPVFYWIVEARSGTALLVGAAINGVLAGSGASAFYAAMTESLPKRIRSGSFAAIYAIANAIFGGTTQLIVTWLTHATGSTMAPVGYMFVAAMVGIVARWLIVESAPAKARLGPSA